jgi:hypothetical protein
MNTRSEYDTTGKVEVGIVEHDGREYAALGSVITDERITAYLGKDGQLTTWDGRVIGRYNVVTSWPTPRSYVSSRMWQVEGWIGQACYTGRSAGEGMVFHGKRVARQRLMKELGASAREIDAKAHVATVLP